MHFFSQPLLHNQQQQVIEIKVTDYLKEHSANLTLRSYCHIILSPSRRTYVKMEQNQCSKTRDIAFLIPFLVLILLTMQLSCRVYIIFLGFIFNFKLEKAASN